MEGAKEKDSRVRLRGTGTFDYTRHPADGGTVVRVIPMLLGESVRFSFFHSIRILSSIYSVHTSNALRYAQNA